MFALSSRRLFETDLTRHLIYLFIYILYCFFVACLFFLILCTQKKDFEPQIKSDFVKNTEFLSCQ